MYNLRSKQDLDSSSLTMQMDSDLQEMLQAVGAGKQEHVSVPCADLKSLIAKIDIMSLEFKSIKDDLQSLKEGQSNLLSISETAEQALQLAEENSDAIDELENRVDALEQIQLPIQDSNVNELVSKLEDKIELIEKQISEGEVENILEARVKELEMQLKSANDEATHAKTQFVNLETSLNHVTRSCTNIDNYMRRDNLLFHNVREYKDENCFLIVRELMQKMGIENAQQLPLVRCSRMKGVRNSPIICGFHFFGDRQYVFENRFKLKGTHVFIEEHFSDEVAQKRKTLFPLLKAAKALKMRSYLRGDKLMVNNIAYSVDNLTDLPNSLKFVLDCYKQNEHATAFFGYRCPLSNFYEISFADEYAVTYHSTEQYLQYHKAVYFKDDVTANKILTCKSPLQAKSLSYEISPVNEGLWQTEAPKIMKRGLALKFSSSRTCRDFLLNTGTRKLGEASPSDKFWGIGIGLTDTLALNEGAWHGQNKMGNLLQEIRESLQ